MVGYKSHAAVNTYREPVPASRFHSMSTMCMRFRRDTRWMLPQAWSQSSKPSLETESSKFSAVQRSFSCIKSSCVPGRHKRYNSHSASSTGMEWSKHTPRQWARPCDVHNENVSKSRLSKSSLSSSCRGRGSVVVAVASADCDDPIVPTHWCFVGRYPPHAKVHHRRNVQLGAKLGSQNTNLIPYHAHRS